MASNLLSFAGWTFLPEFIGGYLQTFYYNFTIRAGDPKPRPGSPEFNKHKWRIQSLVIVAYLIYTIYEADWEIQRAGNFYNALGVPFDVDERRLNSRFRKLTLEFHPDKIHDPTKKREAESYYVYLKLARDTLVEPARRWAYDRFGADVTQWRHCVTMRDFVYKGLTTLVPYYVGSTIVMIAMGFLGFFQWGKHWRYLAIASLAVYEFSVVTTPSHPFAPSLFTIPVPTEYLSRFLPAALHNRYLPFEWLKILHKSIIAFFIAIERLGPVINAEMATVQGEESEAAMQEQLRRLERAAQMTSTEAQRHYALEMAPFHPASAPLIKRRREDGPEESEGVRVARQEVEGGLLMRTLRTKVKDWLVLNTVRNNPNVQEAVRSVVQQRREEQEAAYARIHGQPS